MGESDVLVPHLNGSGRSVDGDSRPALFCIDVELVVALSVMVRVFGRSRSEWVQRWEAEVIIGVDKTVICEWVGVGVVDDDLSCFVSLVVGDSALHVVGSG